MATADSTDGDGTELRPFREQEPFLQDDHRYYGYVSGVGAGKTFAGMLRTALNMEEWNPGEMGAIVAPTTTMVKDVILPLMRDAGLLDVWEYKSMHADEPGLHAPNGSRALILSADNRRTIERLAGLNLAWWWLDEASRVDARAHEILEQRLRVGQYRNGYHTTTPRGRDYIHDFYVGENGPREDRLTEYGAGEVYEHPAGDRLSILYVPTWANPHTADDYQESMREKEGQTYEREILGRFVEFEGRVYPWFDDENIVGFGDLANFADVYYGLDWGKRNPFAIVCVARTNRDRLAVIDEVYKTGLDYNEMVSEALALQERHGRGRWYCDPSEPSAIDMLQRAGLDAEKADNSVMPGIQYVSAQRDRLMVCDSCTELRDEFRLYHYPDDGESENPVEANDHLLDALRYALFTHQGPASTGILGSDPDYL